MSWYVSASADEISRRTSIMRNFCVVRSAPTFLQAKQLNEVEQFLKVSFLTICAGVLCYNLWNLRGRLSGRC
jgi:hypothetical protein